MECNAPASEFGGDEAMRPFKRRKFIRKRATSPMNDGVDEAETPNTIHTTPEHQDITRPLSRSTELLDVEDRIDENPRIPVAELLRRRRALKKRAGIEFSNAIPTVEKSLAEFLPGEEFPDNDDSLHKVLTVVDRFAPQTGQVADVDKHMPEITSDGHDSADDSNDGTPGDVAKHRQPAALGKLHEIDLGQDATLRNIARTEAAKKRLEGGESEPEAVVGKVRLRRDGKPWRGRRRRTSLDVKRDKLVEEVMKESRLEIYDEPEMNLPNDDQAADDQIAEKFRREFMDAISSRRQRATQAAKKGAGTKIDDKPRGPKLGGSRSARAAMREQQEKAAKK
ncbi:MAG: hypothetical protein Q9220_000636 [cf. Caloplaca sp. 1 TL-2023]